MKKLIIIALLASGGWAIDQPTFSQFDLNNDAKITPEELEEGFKAYRKQCEDNEEVFTIVDLAEYLGIDRDTIWNYGKKDDTDALKLDVQGNTMSYSQ